MKAVNKNSVILMNDILAVSHLLVLLDDQSRAHTYDQQKGTCSRCGGFMWCIYMNGAEEGQSTDCRSRENIFFFLFFSECCTFSRCWIGSLRGCAPTRREERHKGHSGNRSFLSQRFLTQMGRTVFTVAVAGSLHDSVFICFVQLWSRVLIAKMIEYSF